MIERGLHHKIWARPVPVTNSAGIVHYRTNSYTELQTGISYTNTQTGLLEESCPDFQITPRGYAVASKCQHQLIVSPDVSDPEGVVDCLMPDGRRLRSGLAALYLFSPVTGKSLQIAAVKSCTGEQTAPNEITFPDVFEGMLRASLRVRNERGGYHHDLLLNERFSDAQLEKLASLGFDSTMRLEVWTEFFEAPSPAVREAVVGIEPNSALFAEPNTLDASVDFGAMRLGLGRSFVDGDEGEELAPVYKRWLRIQQRAFVVESASFAKLAPLMERLPASTMTVQSSPLKESALLAQRVPPARAGSTESRAEGTGGKKLTPPAVRIARFDAAKSRANTPRLVLDHAVLNGTLTNLTCHSETTWFVTGPVNVSGTLTFQANCVVKLTNSPVVLMAASNIVCQTGPYGMGVLTSWCDDSVGEGLPYSTGIPTNYNAGTYLEEQWFDNTNLIKYMRFLYAGTALHFKPRDGVWHSQFLQCQRGLAFTTDGSVWLHNVLFSGCSNAVYGSGYQVYGEHLTVDGPYFNMAPCAVHIMNSIFVGAISKGDLYFDTDHFATNSTRDGMFQAVGAGNYYLATNSANRFKGGTEINATLLADLRKLKTTYPPLLYGQTNVSGTLIFHPQHEPTNSQPPDLGYAYDRLDYALGGMVLTNGALTVSPGTAIATYQTNGVGYGLALQTGAQLFCEGSPTNLIHITVYNTVQEQPMLWSLTGWRNPYVSVWDNFSNATPRLARFRFTDWSTQMVRDLEHLESVQTTPFAISDCQFHSGFVGIYGARVQLTNCLFERSQVDLEPGGGAWQVLEPSFVRNNLFIGGGFAFWSSETNSLITGNLFDGTIISFLGATFSAPFNAYVTNAGSMYYRLWPTNATDIILPASPAYQAGPLGQYYQLASSVLMDADTSTHADEVGLFHYTVCTNIVNGAQIKETNSWVDCGLHYVALDSGSSPVDADGGGVPNFIENGAGDGLTNNVNESNWRNSTDDYKYLLTPEYLRVEYRENPWGITTNYGPPRFYWIVTSNKRAEKQLAYRILVATSTNNLNSGYGDMWDSGMVFSDQTIHVPYGKTNLTSNQRLWWKVITWDPYTGLSKSSTNAFFQVGLLSTNDWLGKWLTTSTFPGKNVSPIYRRVFQQPTNDIKHATLYASAKGVYELWLNGERIGRNVLAPEWTDYNLRVQYQTFDVTPALMSTNTDGTTHVIGGIVAEGWFSGSVGQGDLSWLRYTNCTAGRGSNQLFIQLAIERNDGSVTNIVTDADGAWTCSTNGPVQQASIEDGETYDARKAAAVAGWSTLAGDTNTFNVPVAADSLYATQMFAQPTHPIQVFESRTPVDMWTNKYAGPFHNKFVRVFDMGQVIEGWCSLTLVNTNNPEGTVIQLRHAERLELDGNNLQLRGANINTNTLGTQGDFALQTETYWILNNWAAQSFEPHFTYHSFRFVEVDAPENIALTTNSLVGRVAHSTLPITAWFSCSRPEVNRLITNILWTLKANVYGIFTACSDRTERSGWFGDTDVFSKTACFLMDMASMYTKICRDIRDDQNRPEYFNNPDAIGYYCANNPWAGRSAGDIGTASGGVQKPWHLYENYADTRMLKEHYLSASNWMRFLIGKFPNYVADGDWVPHANSRNGGDFGSVPTNWPSSYASLLPSVYGTCHYAHSADILAGMSKILQTEAEAAQDSGAAQTYGSNYTYYTTVAASVRTAFTNQANEMVSYSSGSTIDKIGYGSQADYALALFFNMIPEAQRSNCADKLVNATDAGVVHYNHLFSANNTNHVSTGIFETGRGMLELTRNGYTSTAYDVLLNAQFPGWLYQITNGGAVHASGNGGAGAYGSTTIWERWNGWLSGPGGGYAPPYSSFNQVWNGAVGEWIFRVVAGINRDPLKPGFENVLIEPQPGGDVTNAFASFGSIRGIITTSWTNTVSGFDLTIRVPANTTADVSLPTATLQNINEGSSAATNAPGVMTFWLTNSMSVFRVGSGSYDFHVNY